MTDLAATKGQFCDFRTVKTRKVAQFIFEVPIEEANQALQALGGIPDPTDPPWVAIARLQEPEGEPEVPNTTTKEKGRWHELRPSAQAAIRCHERAFWRFLGAEFKGGHPVSEEGAASLVRMHCKVNSRSLLDANDVARNRWNSLDDKYRAWMAAG